MVRESMAETGNTRFFAAGGVSAAMRWISLTAGLLLAGCSVSPPVPVTLAFPDFPENSTVVDLGQSVTIDVAGDAVTWSCAGAGCAPLRTTPTSVTFKAAGITGKAVLTAMSKKQPAVKRDITVAVGLNDSPDMLCK
jgi:hypothetical protein